nr:hypothetical protein [Tanacetum cinerariifolium]
MPLSKKRPHKEVSTPRKNGKLLPSVTNLEADHAHVTTPTNLASSTNAAQFNNIPGMSGLASPYYSNVGNITSSLAVKCVVDVVDDSTTKWLLAKPIGL